MRVQDSLGFRFRLRISWEIQGSLIGIAISTLKAQGNAIGSIHLLGDLQQIVGYRVFRGCVVCLDDLELKRLLVTAFPQAGAGRHSNSFVMQSQRLKVGSLVNI